MPRDRAVSPHDRLVTADPDGARFRIAGVEPHGWSTVLIEDTAGRHYVLSAATGRLSEVHGAEAQRLFNDRIYRRWNGNRQWSALDRLPLVAQVASRAFDPLDTGQGDALS